MTDLKSRDSYRCFKPITTRWHDTDLYGHVNNVVYHGFFDTAVNGVLIEHGRLDIHDGPVIALVVCSGADSRKSAHGIEWAGQRLPAFFK